MKLIRAFVLVFLQLGIWVGGATLILKGYMDTIAANVPWFAHWRWLLELLIGIWATASGQAAYQLDTNKMKRMVWADLGLGDLLNADKIEEAAKQAVASGVPKEHVEELRAKSAEKLVEKLATAPAASTGALPLDTLDK